MSNMNDTEYAKAFKKIVSGKVNKKDVVQNSNIKR